MAELLTDLYGNPITPPPKCRHCGRTRMNHQAKTFNCPIGRGNFPSFGSQVFEPRQPAKRTIPAAQAATDQAKG